MVLMCESPALGVFRKVFLSGGGSSTPTPPDPERFADFYGLLYVRSTNEIERR